MDVAVDWKKTLAGIHGLTAGYVDQRLLKINAKVFHSYDSTVFCNSLSKYVKPLLLTDLYGMLFNGEMGSGDKQSAVHGSVSAVISVLKDPVRSSLIQLAQEENQAIKRQKLEEGKARQILSIKPQEGTHILKFHLKLQILLKKIRLQRGKNLKRGKLDKNAHIKITSEAPKAPNFAQENQATKRQKLEEGKARQILSIEPQTLLHKTRPGKSTSNLYTSTAKTRTEDRKICVREPAAPFISMAEMMKTFEYSTREMSMPRLNCSMMVWLESVQRK
ncbi:PREDICTED: uncharacterized protein LOC109169800 [Ipomoea nil]|uniref:uncharacterized protein LOC109169800 n=1 Tax=Ipomoea nil TaxID=35883 RepID=UPI000901ED0E|nr:PREDICTED: uncharacterized protein LOC109169800 [Ipomoea nil]